MRPSDPPAVPAADEERFRALHEQTYPDLLRFVERRVAPSDAEDVVSTVFLTAWRRLGDVPEDARPWLFGVARKVMANDRRSSSRRGSLDVRVAAQRDPDVSESPEDAVVRVDLARAWRTLSAPDREVLALVAFDGLRSEQAAVVLGCRRSTFAMRLARARHRLRQALGPDDPREERGAHAPGRTTSAATPSATPPTKEDPAWTRTGTRA